MGLKPSLMVNWLLAFAALLLSTLVLPSQRADAAVSNCSITTTGVAFSPYDSLTKTQVDGAGSITVSCTVSGNNALNIRISGGNADSCTTRQMRMSGNNLGYQIYRDATRSNLWCNGTTNRLNFNFNFSGTGTQTQSQTFTMYGRVTGNQNPPYGAAYSDSLTVALYSGNTWIRETNASITGSVAAICSVSAGTLGFGTYDPANAALATATVSVSCSNSAPYQVSLGGGNNLSGTTRRMVNGGQFLSYELYSDSARSVAWGDGTALGARVAATGSGTAQNLIVYGRIPAGQYPPPATYSDRVVVTLEY